MGEREIRPGVLEIRDSFVIPGRTNKRLEVVTSQEQLTEHFERVASVSRGASQEKSKEYFQKHINFRFGSAAERSPNEDIFAKALNTIGHINTRAMASNSLIGKGKYEIVVDIQEIARYCIITYDGLQSAGDERFVGVFKEELGKTINHELFHTAQTMKDTSKEIVKGAGVIIFSTAAGIGTAHGVEAAFPSISEIYLNCIGFLPPIASAGYMFRRVVKKQEKEAHDNERFNFSTDGTSLFQVNLKTF